MKYLDKCLLSREIEKAAQKDIADGKVFGSAYSVYQSGEEVYKKCFGFTSPDGDREVNEKTLFRMASMTKPVTTVAAMILIERGAMALNDRIDKYLPAFADIRIKHIEASALVDKGAPLSAPTVFNILTHTSGIGSNVFDKKIPSVSSLDGMIDRCVEAGLDFEPFSKQSYSGICSFDVLAKIIETVSGKDYEEFLKREIYEPCEMTDTTFLPSEEQLGRLTAMHCIENGKSSVREMHAGCIFEDIPMTHYLGGAGLVSTLDDYGKFALMLQNGVTPSKKRILSEKTVELIRTPQVPYTLMPSNERWGLGMRVITEKAYKYLEVGSFGWSGAYGTHFWVDPENKITAVFMKNSAVDGGSANASARRFEKAVFTALGNETDQSVKEQPPKL